jgi:histone chaperone ASF1
VPRAAGKRSVGDALAAPLLTPLRLTLCHPPDLEWKLTYVGSAQSDNYDQELDSLLVGPIPVGVNKFVFEADPPDTKRIPVDELLGVTVVLLTCSYDGREFVRVGYYVNNEYDEEELVNDPPAKPVIEKIRRNVLSEKPRVTRFAIKWYVFLIALYLSGC